MTSAQLTTIAAGTTGFIVFLMFRRWLWFIVMPPGIALLVWIILDKFWVTSH